MYKYNFGKSGVSLLKKFSSLTEGSVIQGEDSFYLQSDPRYGENHRFLVFLYLVGSSIDGLCFG